MEELGKLTVIIEGKERKLYFRMRAAKLINEVFAQTGLGPVEQIAAFLYAGLMSRAKENDLPADFSVDTCIDWMDTLTDAENERIVQLGVDCLGFLQKITNILDPPAPEPPKQAEENPQTKGDFLNC